MQETNKTSAIKLFSGSQNGYTSKALHDTCQNYDETLTLIHTNYDTIIGFYCPDKFELTTGKKNSFGWPDFKDIENGKPFLFYF